MAYITTRYGSAIRSQTVYACYCCSRCANPVVTRLNIQTTESDRISKYLGSTESELNEQVSEKHAQRMEKALAYLMSPHADLYPEDPIEGMDSPCPVCNNLEPWQTKEQLWKIEASGPIQLFPSLLSGYAWAQEVLRKREAAAGQAAIDPAVMRRGQERLLAIGEELRACEAEKNSGAAARELASLREKETALNTQLKSLSVFSKDKKLVDADLEQCRAALTESQERYHAVVACEDAKVAKLVVEQAELSLYDKALTDRAILHENKYSIALSLAASDTGAKTSVSLAALPKTGKHSATVYAGENRGQLLQMVAPLNEALHTN